MYTIALRLVTAHSFPFSRGGVGPDTSGPRSRRSGDHARVGRPFRRKAHQGLPPPSMPPPPVMVKLATWETPIKAEALRGHDVGSADVVTLPSMSSVVLDQASPEKAMGQML